jgi:catechol 2,3-dioxygenase
LIATIFNKVFPLQRLGEPVLRVIDLELELEYYQKFNMKPTRRFQAKDGHEMIELAFDMHESAVSHNDNHPILTLMHDPGAIRPHPRSAGLFHFAILTPDRKSLATTFISLEYQGVQFAGFADHLVSESLYLQDPEDNGIEIYCDRPRKEWQFDENGHIQMDTIALDFPSLLSELNRNDDMITKEPTSKNLRPFPRGATIGHIHLKVNNLAISTRFYREILGLDLMKAMHGASFLSLEGYHHRLAINTWLSRAGISLKGGEAGLENFTIYFSDEQFYRDLLARVPKSSFYTVSPNEIMATDPDGIRMKLTYNGR